MRDTQGFSRDTPGLARDTPERQGDGDENRHDSGKGPSRSSLLSLDWLNFFLADVQSGVGPFLAVYLASMGWNEERVGIALTASGIAGILAQTPVGGLVDRLRSKRALIAVSAIALAMTGLVIATFPLPWPVMASEIVIGVSASVFVPAVCAISMGLVGRQRFDRRQGRNQAFNSAGNVFAAVTMGGIGYFLSNRSIFYFVAALAVPTLVSLSLIRSDEIDYGRARGAAGGKGGAPRAGANDLKWGHTLTLFLVCSVMYHFANAAMLSLLGEMLSKGQGQRAMVYMSACVVTTQLIIMASASFFSGVAGRWGRRPTLMIAFAILPIRGLLYLVTSSPLALISIQVLDGVASSIFGVVSVLVIADIAKGSGRFNLMLGAFTTAIGVGAALSQLVAGSIAHRYGYHAGFGFLTGMALVALVLLVTLMPETHGHGRAEGVRSRREAHAG